jgi:branched-subunit amino acid ABC-type transport system permease component
MQKLIQTLIIGLEYGCIYALIALGMVLVYRTTGVLNIAHGGVGVLAGFVAWDLNTLRHWPYFAGCAAGIAVAVALGFGFERLVVRRLPSPALATVATLALFLVLQGLVFVVPWWGNTWGQVFDSPFANKKVSIPGANYAVSWDQLVLFGSVGVFLVGLYFILRRTRLGLAMRAVSDDPTAARLMGIRQRLVAPVVWCLAFGLSGLTTMLLAPILSLDNTSLTAFTLKALTVTFIGGLISLPLTVLGGLALALLEVSTQLYITNRTGQGLSDAWPFVMLVVVLLARFARGTKALEDTAVAPA